MHTLTLAFFTAIQRTPRARVIWWSTRTTGPSLWRAY